MYRDDTGNIDFVWGREGTGAKFKHGYGLAHIIAKRNSENGNGIETAKKLVEVIAKGTKVERQESQNGDGEARLKIHYDGYTAVLSLSRDKNTWLLTGWEDNDAGSKKATVNASGEGYDSTTATTATPTLTRRNGETVASVTKSVARPAENVKKLTFLKGTTVDVSVAGDNVRAKFNGEQGNDNLFRFRIVAKEDKQAEITKLKLLGFCDIIKEGKVTANAQSALPAIIPDGMKGQVRGTLPSTISVAKLLTGVKGRNGKLLVNKKRWIELLFGDFKGIK